MGLELKDFDLLTDYFNSLRPSIVDSLFIEGNYSLNFAMLSFSHIDAFINLTSPNELLRVNFPIPFDLRELAGVVYYQKLFHTSQIALGAII